MKATTASDSDVMIDVPRGLHNVVVTQTGIGDVRGREGFYHYRGYSATELARSCDAEAVWHLMVHGALPDGGQAAEFRREVRASRVVAPEVRQVLAGVASLLAHGGPLEGLRAALSLAGSAARMRPVYDLSAAERVSDTVRLCAQAPTLLAALHRLQAGQEPIEPRPDLGQAANYLYMLTGSVPGEKHERAIETYLVSTIDHGFNASTFTARVITSTGADVAAALTGAIGALSGPLHGGAPSRALDTLDAIGDTANARPWLRQHIESGARVMGFGHAVYRTEDPRSRLLKEVARSFGGPRVDLALHVEAEVEALLAELKPGRELHTNVEFYAGVVMEACGIPRSMFTPTFAVGRLIGWSAHVLEQADDRKIIRPSARYTGSDHRA